MQEHQWLFPQNDKHGVTKFDCFAQCEQPAPETGNIPNVVVDAIAEHNSICETRMPEFGQHTNETKDTEHRQQ